MPSAESKAADGSTLRKRAQEKAPKDSPRKRTRRASATRTSNKNLEDAPPGDNSQVIVVEPTETPLAKKFDEPPYVDNELDTVAKKYSDDKLPKKSGPRSRGRSRGKKQRKPIVTASTSRNSSPTPRATAFYRPVHHKRVLRED